MSADQLRVAILGTRHVHLRDQLAAIRRSPVARLVAVYPDGDGPPPPDLDGAVLTRTPEAALAEAEVVVIGSTTARHDHLLRSAVAAARPTLVEKPLAVDFPRTCELVRLIEASAVPVTTAMFLRCTPALRQARVLLDRQALGEVVGVHFWFAHPGGLDGVFADSAGWMLDPAEGGTGGFADLAIHAVDLLCWLWPGEAGPVHGIALRRWPGSSVDVGGVAVLGWGLIPVTIDVGWVSRPGGFAVRIEGTGGTLWVDGGSLRLAGSEPASSSDHRRLPDHLSWGQEGRPPAAADAVTAFLDQLAGYPSWQPPSPSDLIATARVLADLAQLS